MNEPETITLAEVLATRPLLRASLAAELFCQLLDLLEPLHARGEIQHALLPHSIGVLRYEDGSLIVRNLGPRQLPSHPPRTYIRDGMVELDLRYISPELVRGKPLGPAHDLFVLGIVLFELVTGFHPFETDNDMLRMEAIVTGSFKYATSTTSCSLLVVAEHLLAPDPTDRIADIAELRGELSDALGDHELIEDELRRFVEPELHAGTRTRDELVTWAAEHFVDIRRDCLHPIGERMELPGYLEVLAGQVVDELLAHDQRA